MKNGQIMQSGTPEELLKTGLIEHLFGVSLTPPLCSTKRWSTSNVKFTVDISHFCVYNKTTS